MTRLMISFLLGAALCAQEVDKDKAEPEWVKIRQIKAVYEEAVSTFQIEKLRPHVARGFHGVLVNGRVVNGFDDLVKAADEIRTLIGNGGTYNVKTEYAPGTMFPDVALAHGTAQETVTTAAGKRFEFQSTWTASLVKEDGAWKLFRIQATMDPVNNVFVADTIKGSGLLFGGGGALIGALAGFLLRGLKKS